MPRNERLLTVTRSWRGVRRLQELFWSSTLVPKSGGLAVDDHVVIADEIGRAVDEFKGHAETAFEEITTTTWVRKTFVIERTPPREVKLCISGEKLRGTGRLVGTFNGASFGHSPKPNSGFYGDWVIVPLPMRVRRGENELILRTAGSLVYRLFIEPSHLPNRSARSLDAGRSWDDRHLGLGGFLDGEYVLRLSGRQPDAAGEITSPPIQIRTDDNALAPAGKVTRLAVEPDVRALVDARLGSGPWLDRPGVWTAWARPTATAIGAMEAELGEPGPRFVQFRLRFGRSAAESSVLKKVTLRATLRSAVAPPVSVQIEGPPTVLSGEHFAHQRPHERLAEIRRRFKLDSIFNRGRNEWEGLLHLAAWVGEHCCWYGQTPFKQGSPYEVVRILRDGHRREGRVMCGHLAFALVQLAAAMGYTGRVLLRGNHLVTEMFSPVHRKWAVLDQQDQIRDRKTGKMIWGSGFGGYYHNGDNMPMSAIEIGAARGKVLRRHLVYPGGGFRSRPATVERDLRWYRREISYPLRNNHTDVSEPVFFADVFHFAGHLKFRRRARPVMPYYWRYTARPGDVAWTAGEVSVFLTAMADGTCRAQLRSQMPNTTAYRWVTNDDAASGQTVRGDERSLRMTEVTGKQLSVRAINAFAIAGPRTICRFTGETDVR